MQKIQPIEYGKFYHIYNRGINRGDIFFERDNYEYFMKLYENHIDPIAETYAWCLMKNHFHFLVRIKDEKETRCDKMPHQYFSNLFNAYTKAINKKYDRQSSLFQRSFKRKLIKEESYFKRLIIYIHNNPVNHQICENAMDYPWSSYLICLSDNVTNLKREEVINWFNDASNFRSMHKNEIDLGEIESYLEI
jgi:putative transposase